MASLVLFFEICVLGFIETISNGRVPNSMASGKLPVVTSKLWNLKFGSWYYKVCSLRLKLPIILS